RSASAIARSLKEGGVAERFKRYREASADREVGVVFRREQKENHPGCVRCGGIAKVFNDAATPPSLRLRAIALALRDGDARSGLLLVPILFRRDKPPVPDNPRSIYPDFLREKDLPLTYPASHDPRLLRPHARTNKERKHEATRYVTTRLSYI